ncbi:hypothetical protein MtrunA17_Chr6g0474261 [Medicago truncatula]|uniref:Late nodulin n=2 Tax=Medicago truncatula TaxID=3880 RepID=A0A396HF08_MEDTR|nr:hypothetical protein MtrunA17_Chr6g0474261 [Medicago truncatula]
MVEKMVGILKFVCPFLFLYFLLLSMLVISGKHDYHMFFQRIPCPKDKILDCNLLECWCK